MDIDINKIDIKVEITPKTEGSYCLAEARLVEGLTIFTDPNDPTQPSSVKMEIGYQS